MVNFTSQQTLEASLANAHDLMRQGHEISHVVQGFYGAASILLAEKPLHPNAIEALEEMVGRLQAVLGAYNVATRPTDAR